MGVDRRNCEARHAGGDGEKVKRPLHDSLLSQYFWDPDDDEMESRPPDRKRKCRGYPKRKSLAVAGPAAAVRQQDAAETSSRSSCESNWHDLPMELLVRILSLVDNRTVITASGVCHGWRDSVGQGIHDLSFSWYVHTPLSENH